MTTSSYAVLTTIEEPEAYLTCFPGFDDVINLDRYYDPDIDELDPDDYVNDYDEEDLALDAY